MSNTFQVSLSSDDWTEVANSVNGIMTNETTAHNILFVETDSPPLAESIVGHTLPPISRFGVGVSFILDVGQIVYAKTTSGVGTLSVTLE